MVTLLPLEPPASTSARGGVGLTSSFATFASTDTSLKDLKFILAHELFHTWNYRKLGELKQPEVLRYWFSEGFTNYYTWLMLLRGGLSSLDDYVEAYNSTLRIYYNWPVRSEPNERVRKDFFSNYDVSHCPISAACFWRLTGTRRFARPATTTTRSTT